MTNNQHRRVRVYQGLETKLHETQTQTDRSWWIVECPCCDWTDLDTRWTYAIELAITHATLFCPAIYHLAMTSRTRENAHA